MTEFILMFLSVVVVGPLLTVLGIVAAALGVAVVLVATYRLAGAVGGLAASGGCLGAGLSVEPMAMDEPLLRMGLLAPHELDIVEVTACSDEARCPVCATDVGSGPVVTCPRCSTPHHRDCWEFNGSCAVFGCRVVGRVVGRSPTTDSSSSPSSLSSPSPDLVAALVADTEDEALALRRRFRRWFWLTRIQWWSLCALSVQVCLVALLDGVGMLDLLPELVAPPFLVLFSAWALLAALAVLARRRLEDSLQGPALVPPARLTALVRRIEHSRSLPLLERMLRWYPAVYGLAAVVALVAVLVKGHREPDTVFAVLLVGCLSACVARWSAGRHRMALDVVRARLWRHRIGDAAEGGEVASHGPT